MARKDETTVVVIVGPCASGKSTLAAALIDLGIDARIVAQEHSVVPDLWRRPNPDILIGLNVDLDILRARRAPTWPASVYASQQDRLVPAFAAADLVIDTSLLDVNQVIGRAVDWLRGRGFVMADGPGGPETGVNSR